MQDSTLTLDDGRTVAYVDLGDPDGRSVLFFHGAPSSRKALVVFDDAFRNAGVRVVAPDRPGFGGSSPRPGRTLAGYADEVARIADALGIERFAAAGHSSGGPYAVVCTALLPDRVTSAAVIAGTTDMGWADAWDGYVDVEEDLMRQPDEVGAIAVATEKFGADGSGFLDASGFELSAPDRAVLDDPTIGPAAFDDIIQAFAQGVAGYAQDVWIEGRPWTFDPGTIGVPVRVLQGEADSLMPMAHSRHTAELIPGATLEVVAGHGHLSIARDFPSVFAALP
ncbi:MAG: alpha/beta hydrolase [Acidimicrobiales bacterium]